MGNRKLRNVGMIDPALAITMAGNLIGEHRATNPVNTASKARSDPLPAADPALAQTEAWQRTKDKSDAPAYMPSVWKPAMPKQVPEITVDTHPAADPALAITGTQQTVDELTQQYMREYKLLSAMPGFNPEEYPHTMQATDQMFREARAGFIPTANIVRYSPETEQRLKDSVNAAEATANAAFREWNNAANAVMYGGPDKEVLLKEAAAAEARYKQEAEALAVLETEYKQYMDEKYYEKEDAAYQEWYDAANAAMYGGPDKITQRRRAADAEEQYKQEAAKRAVLEAEYRQYRNDKYYQGVSDAVASYEAVRRNSDFAETVRNARESDIDFGLFLNRAERAVAFVRNPDAAIYSSQQDATYEDALLKQLTSKERAVILYYAGKNQYNEIRDYLKALKRDLQARFTQENNEQIKTQSEESPILGSVIHTAGSFLSPGAFIGNAYQALKNFATGEYVPTNSDGLFFMGTNAQKASREGIGNAASDALNGAEIFGIDIGRFLSDTLLSIVDVVSKLPLGPTGALFYMGSGAAGNATDAALENGATPGEALSLGVIHGAIEIATEKLPLDSLFDLAKSAPGDALAFFSGILRHMGINASEETISNISGNVVDTLILGDRSEYKRYEQALIDAGHSLGEAEQEAFLQFYVKNSYLSFVSGLLSGGITGSAMSAYNRLIGHSNTYNHGGKDSADTDVASPPKPGMVYDDNTQQWVEGDLSGYIDDPDAENDDWYQAFAGEIENTIDGFDIINGKVGGKVPVDEYKRLREMSIKNKTSEIMTFGKHAEDETSYTVRAGDTSYFDMGDEWDAVKLKYKLTNNEMFEYFNRPAVADAISRNMTIRFSHNPIGDYKSLGMEWNYIKSVKGLSDSNLVFEGGFWYVK